MKLLFITHETSRTGAPMALLYFLQWIQFKQKHIEIHVVGLQGGALEPDFKNACHSYFDYNQLTKSKPLKRRQRLLLKFGLFKRPETKAIFLQQLADATYNVIYANTVMALPMAKEFKSVSPSTKLIAHLHELNAILRIWDSMHKLHLDIIDHIIAASQLVKDNLIANWNINTIPITKVYECTKPVSINAQKKVSQIFHVGASGTVHWRKGSDVFLQVARYIKAHYPEKSIHFTWVGALSAGEKIILEEDIIKMKLGNIISFVGQQNRPEVFYNDFDLFLMTSREDPFPLVCIEVGMLGKPIICFEGATGTEEIIKGYGGGAIVPYLSIESMAEQVIAYYNNPDLVKKHGNSNQNAFSEFTPEFICPQLFEIIEAVQLD